MRVVLPFRLVGQKLVKGRDFPKSIADGSKNTIVVKVDGIPENADANAYFKLSWENGAVYDQAFDGNELVVEEYIFTLPANANNKYIDYKVSMSVAVFEDGDERLTTDTVELVLDKSNYSDDTTNTPEMPQSQYEAFLDFVNGYSINPPNIGDNGNWFVWNGEEYEDTGMPSKGEQITVDEELDETSENPVQNKAIAREVLLMAKDIADLKYVPIDITSISNNVGTVEMGSTVTSVTVSWALNKDPVSQTVDGESVNAAERSVTYDGLSLTAGKTYTVSVTDEREATDTATTKIAFLNGVYYGVGTPTTNILTLNKKLQSGRGVTFNVTAGEGQNVLYALPTRYGTPNFNVGGFDGGFTKATTFNFTNNSGYTEEYDLWVSDNTGLGNTTVKVS